LSLDADVAAKLKAQARRTGRAFKDVVNQALRRGLATPPPAAARPRFTVKARDLGRVKPGLDLDNIGELLDQVEGSRHR
jgi:hypothetical protein